MKIILMLLVMVLVLTGCGTANTDNPNNETEKSYKAAVVVDAEGVIEYVHFDTAQNTAKIDGEGKVALTANSTKKELATTMACANMLQMANGTSRSIIWKTT